RQRANLDETRRVDPQPHENLRERLVVEAPADDVGIDRVAERVRFPLVTEEILDAAAGRRDPRFQQLGELEADLLAKEPEAPADQVLQLILEHDAVDLDTVESELLADGAADLRWARRDEIDVSAPTFGAGRGA